MQPMSPQSLAILGFFAKVGRATQADAREAFPDVAGKRVKEFVNTMCRSGYLKTEGDCIQTGRPVYSVTRAGRIYWQDSQRPVRQAVEKINLMTREPYCPKPWSPPRAESTRAYELPSNVNGRQVAPARMMHMTSRVTGGVPGR